MRRIMIPLAKIVAEMDLSKQVCIMFLDGLPTVNRSCVMHQNRVVRVGRGQGGGIVFAPRLVSLFTQSGKLLECIRLDCLARR